MPTGVDDDRDVVLDSRERERLAAIRAAETLRELAILVGVPSEHEAYFEAKRHWYELRGRELSPSSTVGLPGDAVSIDDHEFHVHGITHAGTDAERAYLREEVRRLENRGAVVFCEQGIRPMYFQDYPAVCELDDLRWAMDECDAREAGDYVGGKRFEGIAENLTAVANEFQSAVFSMIDSGGDVYGDRFRAALGDLASDFLTTHEDLATGHDFESFTKSRQAARDPSKLATLQRYYEKRLLPQPLEREWLARHDPELELLTYARNERMADSLMYHVEDGQEIHLITGAAHQPGVRYYLEQYRDGERVLRGFEPV